MAGVHIVTDSMASGVISTFGVRVAASAFSIPAVSASELCCAASCDSSVWRVTSQED